MEIAEIERQVFRKIISNPDKLAVNLSKITAEDFQNRLAKIVIGALSNNEFLANFAPTKNFFELLLRDRIRDVGELDRVSAVLENISSTPEDSEDIELLIKEVKANRMCREMTGIIQNHIEHITPAKVEETYEAMVGDLLKLPLSAATGVSVSTVREVHEELEERMQLYTSPETQRYPTGLRAFDNAIGGFAPGELVVITAGTGQGKCLGLGTKILKHSGEPVSVEDIKEGDLLMGPDSNPRRVLGTTSGSGELFRITPTDGEPWVCNKEHILTLVHATTEKIIDIRVLDYLAKSKKFKNKYRQFSVKVNFGNKVSCARLKDIKMTKFLIESIGRGEYAGFSLDCDGRFLLGDFTVTHNSNLLLWWAEQYVKNGANVMYVTIEMSYEQTMVRYHAIATGFDSMQIANRRIPEGRVGEFYRALTLHSKEPECRVELSDKLKNLIEQEDIPAVIKIAKGYPNRKNKLFIVDIGAASPSRVEREVQRLSMDHKIDYVFVDFINVMDPEFHNRDKVKELASIARDLKKVARRTKTILFTAAQLDTTSLEGRQDEVIAPDRVKYAKAIGENADWMIAFHRTDEDKRLKQIRLQMAKHRMSSDVSALLEFDFATMQAIDLGSPDPNQAQEMAARDAEATEKRKPSQRELTWKNERYGH